MNSQDIIEMDKIIHKQLKLEELLKKTRNPDKSIYKTQLKMWISLYENGQMPSATVIMLLNNRIKELK